MKNRLENAKRLYALKLKQPLPEFKRYIYNDISNSTARLTAIYGSRGVGKTTLLMQIIKDNSLEYSKKLYISCDYSYIQGVSLFEFANEFSKYGGELLCIDEVHEAKDFELELKQIYDFLNIKVYFTGSSAIALKSPDFARRYSMYHLSYFSLREYLNFVYGFNLKSHSLEEIFNNHENIALNILQSIQKQKILKEYSDFLKVGIYPFYFEDKLRYIDRINDTIDKVLYIDIGKIYSILPDKIENIKKLLSTICVSKPFEFTIENLSREVGITKSTLYKYLNYLNRAELISLVTNEAKRFANIKKADKLYMANCNLLNAICLNKDIGTIRETFFVSQLRVKHKLHYANSGDFLIDEKYLVEVGGKKKGYKQIKDLPNSFIVADDIEVGFSKKIPLWLFGFLY
jgi:predicted AAA+ superfamily ATPase